MLRFGTTASERRPRPATRERVRLWLLFAAACVVLFGIRMLREPETAQRIDRLFVPADESTASPETIREVLGGEAQEVDLGLVAAADTPSKLEPGQAVAGTNGKFDLSAIRDNTYFRPEENSAWFAIFEWLRTAKPTELVADSLGEISYAQFIDQPEVYRGQIVTVRGTVEREESLAAPANDIGIEEYHRLILRPAGGGVWPIVVYSLELPPKFPRGDGSHAEISVQGIFFKNWSYSWQEGLGLAPVVLAKSINWHSAAVIKKPRIKLRGENVLLAVSAAAAIATLVGWFAWRHTRRHVDVLADHRRIVGPPPEEA